MGDEHDGGACVLFQLVHQPKNFGLNGDIQSRCWLIGNQEPGFAGERHGDDHPLAHTAGQFVGILAEPAFCFGDSHLPQEVNCPVASGHLAHAHMQPQTFYKLASNRENRIEGSHRLLENHSNLATPNGAHVFGVHCAQINLFCVATVEQ